MSQSTTILLGGISGLTIFIGLPIARMRGVSSTVKGFMNAIANGILIFLLWDVISKADGPVRKAMADMHRSGAGNFVALALLLAGGVAVGLLTLVVFNTRLGVRLSPPALEVHPGPGAATADAHGHVVHSGRSLALMIAFGLGLHNFSEGLAIGQSAASGLISFAVVLIIGFGLHNITEGFGIAAPLAADPHPPSWTFLLLAGLAAGGPTFIGTVIGYSVTSTYVFVLFLSLAAGALIYIIGEMFAVGRRMIRPGALAAGVLVGFLAGYGTDLLLTYFGG